jgi:formylglycine-generating enzyme required for sulfatase activity
VAPPNEGKTPDVDAGTVPPAATCSDGTKNGDETDVDCGGSCSAKCAATKGCSSDKDCASSLTCQNGQCIALTATDGVKDGTETDVDCGGNAAPKCDDKKTCVAASDCTSGVCTETVCQVPSPTDHVKNGTETGVDCGGPGATPRCGVGQGCADTTDCFQHFCENKLCVEPPSCRTAGNGANTCGPDGNESCCTTLPVPGDSYNQLDMPQYPVTVSGYNLDKYEITQGRIRAFYAAYSGNLRDHPPAAGAGANPHVANSGWQSVWNDRLPGNMSEVHERLATSNGCFGADDAAMWTDAAGANDTKAVNCVDWYTLFAFCIWDGGRLPTEAEWGLAAEGGTDQRKFAWGDTPDASVTMPAGSDPNVDGNQAGKYVVHGFCNVGGPSCFSFGTPYRVDGDGPAHIAPPGQKLDIGRWGHHDMSGNLIEYTLDAGNTLKPCTGANCADVDWPDYHLDRKDPAGKSIVGDQSTGSPPSAWRNYNYGEFSNESLDGRYHFDGGRVSRGGSWEIAHPVTVRSRFSSYPVWRAYYAMGARCARD